MEGGGKEKKSEPFFTLHQRVNKQESAEGSSQSPAAAHSRDPSRMDTKERMRRLQALCKPGKSALSSVAATTRKKRGVAEEKPKNQRRVAHLDSADGKRFACTNNGAIDTCLRRWMLAGTRVMVKLRSFAPHCSSSQEPNRILQGAIVAFDKHWNMVLRDVDEVYVPSIRLGKVQSMPGAMPSSVRYTVDKSKTGRPILARYLKCSMIIGSSVVAIYNENCYP